ncbi:uncharacterized protein LOC127801147 [Diospyros lotus]|uniref:uncharacterized protein LOC127801147 n=1 Tax=Diospyros lotus TaxID=55363 RepID=UPI0022569146|nr:uncharacterized protein LOC127801147 [Diospyros lotus]
MAYLNMLKKEQQDHCTSIPRISFSDYFADGHQLINHESNYREPPVSSDFEFSTSSYGMISADELIRRGGLLPLKEHCTKMTLRDELLVDDDYEDELPRQPRGSSAWWKPRTGLKRPHPVPRKGDKSEDLYANKKTGPK